LSWARYPRSITTPGASLAKKIRKLIAERRQTGIPDLKNDDLATASIEELRELAYLSARSSVKPKKRMASYRTRSLRIHSYVLRRAAGHCEGCNTLAPFRKRDGTPYLEPHHTRSLAADDGPDYPATVIALCPTCHRRAHHSEDAKT